MSSKTDPPTLSAWAESHIKAIIECSQDDLESALDAFISKDATLIVNGTQISRQHFLQHVAASKFQETSATVDFKNTVEIVAEGKSTFEVSFFHSLFSF